MVKSPRTGRWLPYDNDVLIKTNIHLVIEVMGEQHYNKDAGWIRKESARLNLSREQVLADIQWRDEYKKQYALSQGYYYLAIPYWTEFDESYKNLIDENIIYDDEETEVIEGQGVLMNMEIEKAKKATGGNQ